MRLVLSFATTVALAIASLLWGTLALGVPPYSHLALLAGVWGALNLLLIRYALRTGRFRATARTVTAGFLLVLGLGLGVYLHALKLVLLGHGLPADAFASVFPGFLSPAGDLVYELFGALVLPVSVYALTTLGALRREEDE